MDMGYRVAIMGATGNVGQEMLRIMDERDFPADEVIPLASSRSRGTEISYGEDTVLKCQDLAEFDFKGVDIVLSSPGASVSAEYAPRAAAAGAVVIDNTSHFRMDPDVPLVVPEVNREAIAGYTRRGIIANPNCSTIQMVVALNPIYRQFGIKRIVVSTYQAVSGTGKKAIDELLDQTRAMINFLDYKQEVYPHRIAFNCLPHIDRFGENGYTKEEMKMVNETRKILEDEAIAVTATTVRVPVFYGHSEAVNVETRSPVTADAVRDLLRESPGVRVVDDPENNGYPTALDAAGQDLTLVGRIRKDISMENGVDLWIVADNIRKGAATNAIQIADLLARDYL